MKDSDIHVVSFEEETKDRCKYFLLHIINNLVFSYLGFANLGGNTSNTWGSEGRGRGGKTEDGGN